MKFIVDASTGTAVATFLLSLGHDVVSVAGEMPMADDATILEKAKLEQRVVITNDKDFGELVFRSRRASQGVVLIRLKDESSANRIRAIKAVLDKCSNRIENHFSVVTETEIRIRTIPQNLK